MMARAMPANADFVVEVDAAARAWLDSHKSEGPRVITYDVHRCCGGGKICDVRVREAAHRDDIANYAASVLPHTTVSTKPRATHGLPGDKGTGHRMGADSLSALGIRRGAGLARPMVGQRPIMPRIIAGIPSRTNPLTSSACCRIAFVSRGSL